jgi:hypothetical protein
MRWLGNVSRMGQREMHIGYWCGSQKERDHWEDQDGVVELVISAVPCAFSIIRASIQAWTSRTRLPGRNTFSCSGWGNRFI